MNVIIFSLTILAMYAIIQHAFKAWKKADLEEQMVRIKVTEENYEDIKKFTANHGSNLQHKKRTIDKFLE